MANKGLEMIQIKQIIRLHTKGKSYRDITELLGISRKAVTKYVLLFKSTGLGYETIRQMSDEQLNMLMANQEKPNVNRLEILQEQFTRITRIIHKQKKQENFSD